MTLARRDFHRRDLLRLTAGAAALPLTAGVARAQNYPSRMVTLIVPFAPGGATDVAARITAEHMSHTLGQQVVVQNIPGAGGTVGSARAMRAEPDGYTILMGHVGTHAVAVPLFTHLAYKPDVDFAPIGLVSEFPMLVVARTGFPPQDLTEFVAYVKANAGSLNVGHAGIGSVFFNTCILLHSILGITPTLVPFNGGLPAMNALVSGQVDYLCADITTAAPQLEAGTIKAYAIASPQRSPALPTVPTSAEAGLPQFQTTAWFGLFAPRNTPAPVVERLTQALDRALDDDGVRKRMLAIGSDLPEPPRRGPRALHDLVRSEIARWTPIIRASGFKVE
jgi:tripartite-type tricarboxylate transporter receptor subunit TctC